MSATILLVEDDDRLAELVGEYLRAQGFDVRRQATGTGAVHRITTEQPDLVVLDVMLPGESGLTIVQQARKSYAGPVLMLTARGDDVDEVVGLDLGADDYLAKPVRPRVLLARIQALLRRGGTAAQQERIEDGDLVVDRTARRVTLRGEAVELTTAEFDLLWFLATRPGRPVSRQELFKELRGIDYDGVDRSMDVRVSQLRKRLFTDQGAEDRIVTVRGSGYQFVRSTG